jgi:methylated-DNA-[protein]-cysteine S-methyltransferase
VAEPEVVLRAFAQIEEYLAGSRTSFDLPLSLEGTSFMRRVWDELRGIPYGQTRSYRDIAAALGQPGAARAVGMACNRNPVALIIPCHRVVGANGSLVGFAGGLDMKRFLLDLEMRGLPDP